jgi:hypothetical protein
LPADATDFRLDIALKELFSWLSEIDADELPPDPPELPEPVLLELLLLLHPAMSSAAAPAAAAASPALADIEYTDVPRLAFSADMPGHARDRITSDVAGIGQVLAVIVGRRAETWPLTYS